MDDTGALDNKLETIAWGVLLIWWGLRWWPLSFLPDGAGLFGTGLILLSLNIARLLKGVSVKSFTTLMGFITIVWGGIELANSVMRLPFKLPVFEILLIGSGVILLGREFLRTRQTIIGIML